MVKGNHIYTLNCDIKCLEQNQNYDPEVVVKASTECRTCEDDEPKQCKMIANVDDILKLAKELGDSDTTIFLIHQNDELVEIFYELKSTGYEPQVSYECGRITRLVFEV